MSVGQIEHRLLRQLLCMISARSSVQDDFLIRIDHVKVMNPAVGNSVNMAFDKLGKFEMVFAESEPPELRSQFVHRHASLPLNGCTTWQRAGDCGAAER